ncbi:putative hydro-lyase [Marinomonas piezotolerans]|uniref:Putative hydro-lyase DN730_07130 n=1 Tax=Marinomonas piezotolerans TaxID=2213058 RepID=A0A370UCG0_9GAMM|nr:putative hydro-lyase [Marinomonas piezotolerans]RDL45375.1 putative hydro-lyase [Marinomonas piezotolerans]
MSHSSSKLLIETAQLRQAIRRQEHTGPTSGLATGAMQGNVVILPQAYANEFLLYCQKNPVACPLIGVSEVGDYRLPTLGHDIDIRHDVPEYYVYRDGVKVESLNDIEALWQEDMVAFVLGCSFSFEHALSTAGLPPRNIELGVNVSMFETNIATVPAGRFHGNTVVTMRPYTPKDAIRAIQITTRFPKAHGAPLHFGSPEAIGIRDLSQPEFGDPVTIKDQEVPVFWACGVTPQLAIRNAKPPICITHAPGKMLITDILDTDLAVL